MSFVVFQKMRSRSMLKDEPFCASSMELRSETVFASDLTFNQVCELIILLPSCRRSFKWFFCLNASFQISRNTLGTADVISPSIWVILLIWYLYHWEPPWKHPMTYVFSFGIVFNLLGIGKSNALEWSLFQSWVKLRKLKMLGFSKSA